MMDRDTNDEQYAEQRVREAFPPDAGLSAEKTMRMYSQLQPMAEASASRRRVGVWVGASVTAGALLVAAVAFALNTLAPEPLPGPETVATAPAPAPSTPQATVPRGDSAPRAIPALALRAVTSSADVLHFNSVADTNFGPRAGHSEEEMWFDPRTKAGRLVRTDYQGERVALITTIVSDGSAAEMTRQEPGGKPVVQALDAKGTWRKSFDKLSAYRNMLESKTATVTARTVKDGVEIYTVRAEVDGFGGGELAMVMEADIRASDYLPLRCSSGFKNVESGKSLPLTTRTFSDFEHVKASGLPAGWCTPGKSGTQGASV